MKVEYSSKDGEKYTMTISELTAGQMDAIRIILQTSVGYGQSLQADAKVFDLDQLVQDVVSGKVSVK
jgi:hypothetical protein